MALALVLLALCGVQLSLGSITKLRKFRHEPVNFVEVTFSDHHPPSSTAHQVSKRQTGGQPQVNGVHNFHDGYRQGRVLYSGDNSDVIIVLTFDENNGIPYRSNLYRSTDYGSSFTDISERVGGATLHQNFVSRGRVLIFVDVLEPKLYYSVNEGATFNTVTFDVTILDPITVEYHPTRNGWMLMQARNFSLYETTTYGNHWVKVADNVNSYQWGDANYEDDRTIFFTKIDSSNSDVSLNLYITNYPYNAPPRQFDSDLGDHDGFLVVGRYIFAQRTDENGVVGLYVSDLRHSFKPAKIPSSEAHVNYLVANINEAQALVIIEHEGGFYNLYFSDETGIYYSLSLRDLVIERNPLQIDLELIDGLNGTLIANQYTREATSQSASSIRTVISLNNGGYWEGLLPPEMDVNGDEVNCEPPSCSLHLHMDTTNYARLGVYSTDSAPGIIIAHGNTGSELSDDPDLYISRDGGITWVETLAGSWGVNVADHGGLMVAAKDYHHLEESRSLMYSCNEGRSWAEFTFIDYDFTVFGVITEPGQHTTIVSLYGGPWGSGVTFEWVVVTIDFVNIFPRACEDSDYYDWKPWDLRSETSCILGSSITIERRLPEVCCLNGRNYVREFGYSICKCTFEDFECDYGYARPSFDLNTPCFRDTDIDLPNPCADGNTDAYMASTGYRKIAGDVCVDGEAHLFEPFEAPCCGNNTQPPTPFYPQTHIHKEEEEGESGVPMTTVVALGVMLALAILAAGVFMIACFFFFGKYKSTKLSYFRIMTAGEPELSDSPEAAPQELPSVTDDDDKPLVP